MNWEVVTAVATSALAAVAIWGDSFKRFFYNPTLTLSLRNPAGDRIDTTDRATGTVVQRTRYFHAIVSNTQRGFPFTNVTVSLVRILTKAPGGQWRTRWTGPVPLSWQHERSLREAESLYILDTRGRSVGPSRVVDLFRIGDDGRLVLNPIIIPNNMTAVYSRDEVGGPLFLALDIQAHGDQGDSKVMRVEIGWDWIWREGTAEIKDHIQAMMIDSPDQDRSMEETKPATAI